MEGRVGGREGGRRDREREIFLSSSSQPCTEGSNFERGHKMGAILVGWLPLRAYLLQLLLGACITLLATQSC